MEVPLEPLPLPEESPSASFAELSGNPALRLFVDRAQAVRPGFALTEANAPLLVKACRRLDGLPLALELAAARLKLLTLEELLNRLQNRMAVLKGGARDRPSRQQTMEAAIDWSYQLLSEDEKRLFIRLSVFAGGFALDAAEALFPEDPDSAFDLLASLHNKSLLQAKLDPSGERRFDSLEVIREFALASLVMSGEFEEAKRLHLRYCLDLAEGSEPHLRGPDQARWYERLERDHDNFREALLWASDHDRESEIRLAGSLWEYWWTRGHYTEARQRLTTALLNSGEGTIHRAKALHGLGHLMTLQGDYGEAQALLEESLSLFRELGERRRTAPLLRLLGRGRLKNSDLAEAKRLYAESLAISREAADPLETAQTLLHQGSALKYEGEIEQARRSFEEALPLFEYIGDSRGMGMALNNLGALAMDGFEYEKARARFTRSMEAFERGGERGGVALTMMNLADIAVETMDYSTAHLYAQQSLATYRELGAKLRIASGCLLMGRITGARGEFAASQSYFTETLNLCEQRRSSSSLARTLLWVAKVADLHGKTESALELIGGSDALIEDQEERIPPREFLLREAIVRRATEVLGPEEARRRRESGSRVEWRILVQRAFERLRDR
jgi:tetratricopeptide (TPR) repeat protein